MDQLRSTLADATAAVIFPGVVGSLDYSPSLTKSWRYALGEPSTHDLLGEVSFYPPSRSKRSTFLASFCFSLLHLFFLSRPPPPARSKHGRLRRHCSHCLQHARRSYACFPLLLRPIPLLSLGFRQQVAWR